ncbi:3-oxoacyl-ACP reductase FabG [Streptomyces sp. NPDC048638]|uniref:3-oxoacyl-ACP reductase FabG n=1 Tax=Streptomyces sp. NPDC048638 TaxID=3365580 RepID=UPI00370FB4E1
MSYSVLVTGGSGGIGRATALRLAEEGHRVAFTYNRSEPPADLVERGCLPVQCDVTDAEQVELALKKIKDEIGPVRVLVANAGITRDNLLIRMSDDDLENVVHTNLTSNIRLARAVIAGSDGMARAKQGRVIFIGSAVGMRGEKGQVNYAASKAGLIGAARALAREYGSRGITANVVAPGLTRTAMVDQLSEAVQQDMVSQIPLQRMADPKEIASAVAFLAGEGGSYITGAVLPVDGGAGMGH